jgi:hypothetical protein
MKRQPRKIKDVDGTDREEGFSHGIPAVPVWVDIGYAIIGIEYHCNKCAKCREELRLALKGGGKVAWEYLQKHLFPV